VLQEESDIAFEEEILRNPYSVKFWMRYIEHKANSPKQVINLIHERALKELPGSYKLWYNYLKLRRKQIRGKCINDPAYQDVNNTYERALVFMHKMPRLWIDYSQFLVDQKFVSRARRTFDRALQALPITQHHRIWPLYLKFVRSSGIPETSVRVYRRYIKLCPENSEEFIEYLLSIDRIDEAAGKLAELVNSESFVSKEGKSKHQMWQELCTLISKNPDQIKSIKVDAIIRGGLKRFSDMVGQLWNSLADFYIRSGHFEKARDVYEEAIQTVNTVRDFGQVFDAYAQFEEGMLNAKMEATAELGPSTDDDIDIELRLMRYEELIDRRPILLNSVLLRQNPHNVHEWHKRVQLFEGSPQDVIKTFTAAVQTVSPTEASGKPHTLWVAFARFYEDNDQLPEARIIFQKATKVPFKYVDDLAAVWCEFAEMELRHKNYDKALDVLRKATAVPSRRAEYFDEKEAVQSRVYKSLKLWMFYADLEESLGTFDSTKAVYNRIIDLRIANPQTIINFAMFLEENHYFEEAFKAYERGIALFNWPHVYDIWLTYLKKFIARYGGKKLERSRDLFENALDNCPSKFAKTLYLLYAKLEEEYGLARHAMAVYERAASAVLPNEKFEMFNIYISRAADVFGLPYTRQIYERAIESLPDDSTREMCMRFADLESKLGEIDRARAIYGYCSQLCDPRKEASFWKTWHDFEVRHGNEDTFREMLRIKRSIQAKFNTKINYMTAQMLPGSESSGADPGSDDMKKLEERAKAIIEEAKQDQPKVGKRDILFIRGDTTQEESKEAVMASNPEEIDIDDDDDDNDNDVEKVPAPGMTLIRTSMFCVPYTHA
ncbi:uncharacterized protein TRIADDRAFT_21689, partial [Trichoplax adhaerens]